ncbi:pyridoxal phosphate-dependent decarboxylase family protein [Marininema halotolerans]|uniref:L-2,4-diaminobutyrate decarboxylase n=1 Tax=Marininema halotolerans TaxID=1155944 RepID=A0A1I6R0P3_9BACL|nr:aspartate aminotransferase family protein [Marininema halotolerans]SFS58291.1 L-2,4-diaminobutyrate decarboxylase [Marininema halotolerans]
MKTIHDSSLDEWFLTGTPLSQAAHQQAINTAQQTIETHFSTANKPFSGIQAEELSNLLEDDVICPEEGVPLATTLHEVGQKVLRHSVAVHHPACAAHLHCPPLIPALAGEMMVSATNQSMDSWDQSPSATLLEERMVQWLCKTFGFSHQADGVFTSGGTQSNFMGLLLARDHYAWTRFGWNIQKRGLPPEAREMRILCSEAAHFTVKQSAALLGLGEEAVVTIKTDEDHRMNLEDFNQKLSHLYGEGLHPFVIAATAGTTDFGSIDPLPELASRAHALGLWLHVDAAYGGALMLSNTYKKQLQGIEAAHSITVDFHKLFYQPISCGAFLVNDQNHFNRIKQNADYLNSTEDEALGIPNLVGKSIQTTRRFDALKLYISLRSLGRARFADMIEKTIEIATKTAQLISKDPVLQAINPTPSLNTVVFRYLPNSQHSELSDSQWHDQINHDIRHTLLASGDVVLANTKVKGRVCLKLTLLNPRTTMKDIEFILERIKETGKQRELPRGEWGQHASNISATSNHAKLL